MFWIEKISKEALEFCENQANHFKKIYAQAIENRYIIMEKSKLRHDRNIRKFTYEVGDLVLTDHVKLKKGLASGLVHKYYGKLNGKKSKSFLIHKNRLKKYFGHFKACIEEFC